VALILAQRSIGNFDLGGADVPRHRLVTSAAPCVQCFGAIHWSGVTGLVIGATTKDVEELTNFDEGPIHPNWRTELERLGIVLRENVLRDQAREALEFYRDNGGFIYQGRAGVN
jgi:tRNA(Arg) A34 adenosine deaminase TadA